MQAREPSVTIDYESRQVVANREPRPPSSSDAVQVAMGTVLFLFAAVALTGGAMIVLAAIVQMTDM